MNFEQTDAHVIMHRSSFCFMLCSPAHIIYMKNINCFHDTEFHEFLDALISFCVSVWIRDYCNQTILKYTALDMKICLFKNLLHLTARHFEVLLTTTKYCSLFVSYIFHAFQKRWCIFKELRFIQSSKCNSASFLLEQCYGVFGMRFIT